VILLYDIFAWHYNISFALFGDALFHALTHLPLQFLSHFDLEKDFLPGKLNKPD